MRKTCIVVSCLGFLPFAAPATANASISETEWIGITETEVGEGPAVRIIDEGPTYMDLRVELKGFSLETGAGPNSDQVELSIPGEGKLQRIGSPALPVIARTIAVPEGASVRIEVLEQTVASRNIDSPLPAQPSAMRCSGSNPPFELDPNAYASDQLYPATLTEVGDIQHIRHQGVARLELHPFRYQASSGQLEITESMTLRVHFEGGLERGLNPAEPPAFETLMKRTVLGRNTPRAEQDPAEGMLIIAADAYADAIDAFVAWKTLAGYEIEVVTASDIGEATPNGVRGAISERIDKPMGLTEAPLTYVLLVGDEVAFPHDNYSQGPSDFMMADIDGDKKANVMLSRFSATSAAEAELMGKRAELYERYLGRHELPEQDWVLTGTAIASDESGSGPSDKERMAKIVGWLKDYGFTHVSENYVGDGLNLPTVVEDVKKGRGWIPYMGHGDGMGWGLQNFYFDVNTVKSLDTYGKWPIILDCACSNADPGVPESFSDAWMRHGTVEEPQGALATVSSTILASWDEPAHMEEAMARGFATDTDRISKWGPLFAYGIAEMESMYPASAERTTMTFVNLADPSLTVRAKIGVQTPDVTHLVEEDGTIRVTVTNSDGAPLEGVKLALSHEGVLQDVVLSDASGAAGLETAVDDDGSEVEVDLVITSDHTVTYEGTIKLNEPIAEEDTGEEGTGTGDEGDTTDTDAEEDGEGDDDKGCGCSTQDSGRSGLAFLFLLGLGAFGLRGRKRRAMN